MKKTFYLLLTIILFSNCTYRIVRTGYDINKLDYENFDITIKKYEKINDSVATKIGEIKLGDAGFSIDCSEEHAINILKNEGYALNADLIIITEENRPDLWSFCYRCSAEFYKYNDPSTKMTSDQIYDVENIQERVSKDRKKNTGNAIIAVTTGVLLGLITILR